MCNWATARPPKLPLITGIETRHDSLNVSPLLGFLSPVLPPCGFWSWPNPVTSLALWCLYVLVPGWHKTTGFALNRGFKRLLLVGLLWSGAVWITLYTFLFWTWKIKWWWKEGKSVEGRNPYLFFPWTLTAFLYPERKSLIIAGWLLCLPHAGLDWFSGTRITQHSLVPDHAPVSSSSASSFLSISPSCPARLKSRQHPSPDTAGSHQLPQ